ncbi:unnamed protein product [Brachionus calyciflorus]|uniref:mRNA export factor GLE1 n=1 Tax=Brachionus calyciflorus TaxID=104777 RepID=A0A813RSC7_9BILA|nr:unnamed protein product [Brachionus calyciflorus]
MIFDTIESVLKSPLDESQKETIKHTLKKCKHSRLSYNKIEISTKSEREVLAEIEKINCSFENERKSISKPVEELKSIKDTDSNKDILENIILSENNGKDIEEIIIGKEPEAIKSPSHFYLRDVILSPEEKRYIDTQDQNRRKLFEKTKKFAELKSNQKKENEPESLINLKKQQQILKEESLKYMNQSIKKIEKDTTDSIGRKEQKENLPKIGKPFQNHGDVINETELRETEERLHKLVERFKSLSHKCKTQDFEDNTFERTIQKSIEDIDLRKKSANVKNLSQLKAIEAKYSKIATKSNEDIEDAIVAKQRAKKEEEEKRIKRELENKIKKVELEKKFINNLNEFKRIFQQLKADNEKQDLNLESKSCFIQTLSTNNLMLEANHLKNSIENFINQIDDELKRIEKYLTQNFVDNLTEKLSEDITKNLRDNCLDFKNQNEEIEKKLNQIELDVQKSLNELIQTKKAKEQFELERQRLKEAKELEEKLAEKAYKEKLEKEAELKRQQKQEEEKKKLESVTRVQNVEQNNKAGINSVTLINYEKIKNFFDQLRRETEEALNVREFKMYKFELQKAINFPLNSLLEDKNSDEARRIFDEKIITLVRLLSGQNCTITSTLTVSASKHPKAIDFCLVYLARKLVEKGEETVASRPETAFQYSRVIVEVLKNNPKFETILMGQLQERCPYIVPYYKPRENGQTDEQYFESLGYKLMEGKIEEDVHFHWRCFTIKKAWQFLADVLNMTPRPEITAEMLTVFFKCTGYQLQNVYGKQFSKLVITFQTDYLKLIKSIKSDKQSEAAVWSILDEFLKNGKFSEWKKPN